MKNKIDYTKAYNELKELEIEQNKVTQSTILISIILIGFFIFITLILCNKINIEMNCNANGINYDSNSNTMINYTMIKNSKIAYDNAQPTFTLDNTSINCNIKTSIPTYLMLIMR